MSERVFGFLNINKPAGLTSHDVVARVRRHARQTIGKQKVGHAGTLDPMATGVLVICLGHATRLSEYAMRSTKQYRATVHLGVETTTYDAEGEISAQHDASHITRADVMAALPAYIGDIQQRPPIYSAIKKDGEKLYDIARRGDTVELEPRPVTIHAIEIIDWQAPTVTLDVTCGAGTYIRSLAHDIGADLGVGAHLSGLIRTRSGGFDLAQAVDLEPFLATADWTAHLIAPTDALRDWHHIALGDAQIADIQQGRRIARDGTISDTLVMGIMPDGHLLAVLENQGDHWKPHKVFLPQS